MAGDVEALRARLKELAAAIEEVRGRLPAHSAKPPIMHQLLELEDEYDLLRKKLSGLPEA